MPATSSWLRQEKWKEGWFATCICNGESRHSGSLCRAFGVQKFGCELMLQVASACHGAKTALVVMVEIASLLAFAFGCQVHLVYSWKDMLHLFNSTFSSAFCPSQEQLSGARTSSTTTPQRPFPRTSRTTSPRQSARMSGTRCVSVAGFFSLFSSCAV